MPSINLWICHRAICTERKADWCEKGVGAPEGNHSKFLRIVLVSGLPDLAFDNRLDTSWLNACLARSIAGILLRGGYSYRDARSSIRGWNCFWYLSRPFHVIIPPCTGAKRFVPRGWKYNLIPESTCHHPICNFYYLNYMHPYCVQTDEVHATERPWLW